MKLCEVKLLFCYVLLCLFGSEVQVHPLSSCLLQLLQETIRSFHCVLVFTALTESLPEEPQPLTQQLKATAGQTHPILVVFLGLT